MDMRFRGWALLAVIGAMATALARPDDYAQELAKWRTDREEGLKRDNGWLSVAGLYWLPEGETAFTISPDGDLRLPQKDATRATGFFVRHGFDVSLRLGDNSPLTLNGKPAPAGKLKDDSEGRADSLNLGPITLRLIRRAARVGVRIYDLNAPSRKEFTGLKWFGPDPKYRVVAKFVAYPKPKQLPIANIIGDTNMVPNPGYAEFTLNGKKVRLEAQDEGDTYFFNFRDKTTGVTTYPAGRFLDAPKPVNGTIELDFNRAYNPPCAFTGFATCPLPPKQNFLPIAIPAGEKSYGHP